MTDASQPTKKPLGEGLTDDERRMLGALAPAAAPPASVAGPARPAAVSEDEEMVLRRAKEESRRLTEASLGHLFEKPGRPAAPTAGFEALPAQEPPAVAQKPPAPAREPGVPARIFSAVLDFVNAPFRWLPHAFRLGLGLCGVLLLITLILVVLVRALRS